jgi:hypothetical protein
MKEWKGIFMPNNQGPQIINIDNFNLGGLADSKFSGVKYSLYKLVGFDLHSTPGVLKVAQKLTKDSGSTVTEFVKCQVVSTNGNTYHFSSTSGKIWQRTSAGVWSLVYTTVPSSGGAGCSGAREYQGYIYWATENWLHRILASNAVGSAQWSANAAPNWNQFTNGDPSFHPMIEQNLILYIGDANLLAQVEEEVFTADALDITTPYRIKCLGKIGTDVLLGTYVNDTITKTQIFRWNTYSVSFTTSDEIDEVGINCFIPGDNVVYVQAGLQGNIYIYNGEQLQLYRRIPGEYSPTEYGRMFPNAAANFNGKILMGFSKYYVGE